MPLEDLQKPNIGTPDFARGASTGRRKLWALLATVGFGLFWIAGLFVVAGFAGGEPLQPGMPAICFLGLVLGLYGRRRVEGR